MKFRITTLTILAALFMASCAHKSEHKHAASCCEGKQECPMKKKDCAHCKEHKDKDKEECEHKH